VSSEPGGDEVRSELSDELLGSDRDFELTNEFATVRVRRVYTRNGVRLEISSPRLGRAIRLDPLSLESLTWQSHEVFSEFLRHPFGPATDDT
jgi:hypothetical protein